MNGFRNSVENKEEAFRMFENKEPKFFGNCEYNMPMNAFNESIRVGTDPVLSIRSTTRGT
ncbi:MAG: hypothetical protein NTX05_08315 [Fusobacteria bacterium]|nr:hypothetical protein [Fusobacteriota bacterium]